MIPGVPVKGWRRHSPLTFNIGADQSDLDEVTHAIPSAPAAPASPGLARATAAPVVVVGGSPAALTAADALSRQGQLVHLLLPHTGIGRGFVPVTQGDVLLQHGARSLELAELPRPAAPSLDAYRPGPYGFVPWWSLATDYVVELLDGDVREIPTPLLFVDGAWVEDALVTVDLTALARHAATERAEAIAREAAHAEACAGRPSGVLGQASGVDDPILWEMSLGEASRRTAGPTFTDWVVEPAVAKLVPGGADDVVAMLRRKVWMPLFWPRTVQEAFADGEPSFRPQRRFHVDADGGTGRVVDALMARLENRPNIRIERYGRVLDLDDDRIVVTDAACAARAWQVPLDRPAVVGIGAEELHAAVGLNLCPTRRIELVIVWLRLLRPAGPVPAMGFVVDPTLEAFRVSTAGRGLGCEGPIVAVELRADISVACAGRVAAENLVRLGCCEQVDDVEVLATWRGTAAPAPTHEAVAAARRACELVELLDLPHLVVGGASAVGADALNEQIVAGHAAAARLLG